MMHVHVSATARTPRFRAMGIAALALCGAAAAADVAAPPITTVKLRTHATIHGAMATLADVLIFPDDDPRLAEAIGQQPLVGPKRATAGRAAPPRPGPVHEVTHEQVVDRLGDVGVNLARVLVGGAAVCRLRYAVADAPTQAAAGSAAAPREPFRLVEDEAPLIRSVAGGEGARTLADVLRRMVQDDLSGTSGTPEVEFEAAGRDFLSLTSPPFEFAVTGGRGTGLGLREFKVTIRRDGKTQRSIRLGANVKLVRQVVVAVKPLNIGGYITRDSVDTGTRIFTSGDDLGLDHPEPVIGQQVQRFVPAGQMIRLKDVKAVDMVKRSRPVSVEGGGAVRLRLTGVALENGGYGDTVRVRLGDSRKDRREIRGVVTGVGMVRMTEE